MDDFVDGVLQTVLDTLDDCNESLMELEPYCEQFMDFDDIFRDICGAIEGLRDVIKCRREDE